MDTNGDSRRLPRFSEAPRLNREYTLPTVKLERLSTYLRSSPHRGETFSTHKGELKTVKNSNVQCIGRTFYLIGNQDKTFEGPSYKTNQVKLRPRLIDIGPGLLLQHLSLMLLGESYYLPPSIPSRTYDPAVRLSTTNPQTSLYRNFLKNYRPQTVVNHYLYPLQLPFEPYVYKG